MIDVITAGIMLGVLFVGLAGYLAYLILNRPMRRRDE